MFYTNTQTHYVLWYRRGGTTNFTWHSTLCVSTNPIECSRLGTDTCRMGYPTLVVPWDFKPPNEFAPHGMHYWDDATGTLVSSRDTERYLRGPGDLTPLLIYRGQVSRASVHCPRVTPPWVEDP
jgi:hypothetical protein